MSLDCGIFFCCASLLLLCLHRILAEPLFRIAMFTKEFEILLMYLIRFIHNRGWSQVDGRVRGTSFLEGLLSPPPPHHRILAAPLFRIATFTKELEKNKKKNKRQCIWSDLSTISRGWSQVEVGGTSSLEGFSFPSPSSVGIFQISSGVLVWPLEYAIFYQSPGGLHSCFCSYWGQSICFRFFQ